MVFPIVTLLWLIGWSLYWIGSRKEQHKEKAQLTHRTELTFIIPTPEMQHAMAK
jgi:hypothetical protein